MTLEEYLIFCKFEKYFKLISKKFKDKKIIIYGAGSLFQLIQKKYNLSQLNIIGISDAKYRIDQEGEFDLGYKIIPREKLVNYDADIVLLGVQSYIGLLCHFTINLFKGTKTRVYPLVRKPFFVIINDIWLHIKSKDND